MARGGSRHYGRSGTAEDDPPHGPGGTVSGGRRQSASLSMSVATRRSRDVRPPTACVDSVNVTVVHRMSMSGWCPRSSATSATCCTSRIPSRNVGALTERVMASPSCRHFGSSDCSARSISSWLRSAATSDLLALVAAEDLRAQPDDRVVLPVHDALLHRDDRVVGDLDPLGADLGAALGDVAHAQAGGVLGQLATVIGVEGVHVELGVPEEEPRTGEGRLVLLVVPHDVADVLAEEALDALAELLAALDIGLHHPALAVGVAGRRGEGGELLGLLVVEGHVGDEVADHRVGPQRRDRDRLVTREVREPGHAHEPGTAVDLRAAGAALAGLAVPPHREVARLGRLQPVDRVEHDLALGDLDGVVAEPAAGLVATP